MMLPLERLAGGVKAERPPRDTFETDHLVTVRGFVGRNEESSTNYGESTHRAPCCGTAKDAVIAPKRLITALLEATGPRTVT